MLDEKIAARFWRHVATGAEDVCWPYQGERDRYGYGRFTLRGKVHTASRIAYELHHGHPATRNVLHDCDNPSCCNPAHLKDGTHKENTDQAWTRGRLGAPPVLRGTQTTFAKLTEDDVRSIRSLPYRRGLISALALQYGVKQDTISKARDGRTWKHVQ